VPRIKVKRWALWLALLLVGGIGTAAWLYGEIQIDKCLDAGGAWDYQQKHCMFDEPKK